MIEFHFPFWKRTACDLSTTVSAGTDRWSSLSFEASEFTAVSALEKTGVAGDFSAGFMIRVTWVW